MHLVGFIVRIYHDARSAERHIYHDARSPERQSRELHNGIAKYLSVAHKHVY